MSLVVIDAGIALRRFVGGSNADEVTALVDYHLRHGDTLIAPQLIAYEVASVLHKEYVRLGIVTVVGAARVLGDVLAFVSFRDDSMLWVRGIEIAGLTKQRNAYDAQYLALAERENTSFWKADKKISMMPHTANSRR